MKKTDKKSLAEIFPDLIRDEWVRDYNNVLGIDPEKITISNGTPVFWKCPDCGSIYLMTTKKRVESVERKMTSCFTCRGRVQLHPFTV